MREEISSVLQELLMGIAFCSAEVEFGDYKEGEKNKCIYVKDYEEGSSTNHVVLKLGFFDPPLPPT